MPSSQALAKLGASGEFVSHSHGHMKGLPKAFIPTLLGGSGGLSSTILGYRITPVDLFTKSLNPPSMMEEILRHPGTPN